jgi:hypothetical protein
MRGSTPAIAGKLSLVIAVANHRNAEVLLTTNLSEYPYLREGVTHMPSAHSFHMHATAPCWSSRWNGCIADE